MRMLKQVYGEVNMKGSRGTQSLCPKPHELLDYNLGRNFEITYEFLTHNKLLEFINFMCDLAYLVAQMNVAT